MSRILKRNLLCILTALIVFSMALFVLANKSPIEVKANSEIPTTYTTAAETDFYMVEGAQINVDATGIRFVAKVTYSYYKTLTNNGQADVTFYAVVNGAKSDSSKAQMKPFGTQPMFDEQALDTDTFSMEIVIKYDNYVPTTGTYDQAYMAELVADAYVLKADSTWVKAYSPENNQRSMRIVANAAYVAELEKDSADQDADYKGKLANYFKSDLTTRTTEEMAYVLSDGTGKMILPALTDDSYIGAYMGSKNIASVITDNEITLSNVDLTNKEEGDLQYITALTENGSLYTMKVAYATDVLTASNIGTTLLGGANGYYVLGEDINMGTSATDGVNTSLTWGSTTSILAGDFSGTLNGLGHTLKSLTTSSAASGLFKTITDSRIINLNVTGKVRAASGLLAYSAVGECEIDNVYANINRNGQNAVGLIREGNSGAVINVSNTVVEYTNTSTNGDLGYFVARNKGTVNLTNAYGIAGAKLAVGTANSSGTTNGTFSAYDDMENLIVDYANKIASNQV
ncbi:MAG: hypothetical protein IJX03_04740, partial [Clostridia bacterium]|nr:hypothetical protein [Clostridia bacterium]